MQARGIAEIKIVGGHPALDLVNTVASRRGDRIGADYLAAYDDLLTWATRQGVFAEEEAVPLRAQALAAPDNAALSLDRAKRLRECLWRMAVAIAGGTGLAGADMDLLTREVLAAQHARALIWSGAECAWRWTTAAGMDGVTARVAWAAAGLLTGECPHAARLRECKGRNCGWLFVDTTRNGTRLWCSGEECGDLARVTRFRAKRKAAVRAG